MKFKTKEKVGFRINDLVIKEGVIVGYTQHKGKTTYHILDVDRVVDIPEDDLQKLDGWKKQDSVN